MELVLLWIGIALVAILGVIGLYWTWIRLTFAEAPRATEVFKVRTRDNWTVRVCRYRSPGSSGPPVIVCHGIMANQFSFTAPTGDSLVDSLVARGFDCWVMDARGTRSSSPPVNASRYDAKASDYALHDMPAVIGFVQGHTGYERVHWIGHSMGGMMLYMYLAAFGSKAIASGTTLGSPPGVGHFKPEPVGALLFFSGLMPVAVDFLWRCGSVMFASFKINSRLVPINWANMDRRVTAKTFFNVVEFLPYPAAHELTTWIREKRWAICDGQIDVEANFSKMDAPLMLVYGNKDAFTPLDRAQALYASLPNRDKRLLILGRDTGCREDYSHVDLVFSPNGRAELYEPIADWLEAHSVRKGAAKSSHTMPHAHTPSHQHLEKPSHAAALELESPVPERKPAKRATAERKAASRKPERKSAAKPAAKPSYATQRKVALKKKAAKQKAVAKKTVKKKPTAKKKAAVRKSAAKKKPATAKKTATAKKPATAKKSATAKKPAMAKKPVKKKPATRKR